VAALTRVGAARRPTKPRAGVLAVLAGYRADAPRQDSIAAFGNGYLRRYYPQLDSIVRTRVIRRWP